MSRAYDFWVSQQLEPEMPVTRTPQPAGRAHIPLYYADSPELTAERRAAIDDEHLRRNGIDPVTGKWMV